MPEITAFEEIHTMLVQQAKRDMVEPGHQTADWLSGYSEGVEHALQTLESFGSTTVDDPAEFGQLPRGVVVRSADGTIACRFDETRGIVFGDDRPFPWHALALPLVVLYMPQEGDHV